MTEHKIKSLRDDKRILVVGICGAGKSTLAKQLSQKLDLPIIHLDQHFWKAGWVQSEKDEWTKKVQSLVEKPQWIMEGNYNSSFDIRFPKADTIIVLDLSPSLAIFRSIKRIVKYYGRTRPDLTAGCNERFNWEFMKFIWNFPKNHAPRTDQAIKEYCANKKVIRLATLRQVKDFLEG